MTKALPTKDRITEIATEQGRKSYAISAELKLKKPAIPIISVDLGTLFTKNGYLSSSEIAYVEKTENFLSEVSGLRRNSVKKGSFSQRNRKAAKSDLTITYQGRSYSLGKSGAITGGTTNLESDKTDNVVLRILFALTLYEIGKKDEWKEDEEGQEIHLTVSIDFTSKRDFDKKEQIIRNAVGAGLTWGTSEGIYKVKPKTLKVDPEDYHAELFSRLVSADAINFEDEDRATIGIGFRTLNLGIITSDGYFDDERSRSFDGKGTSLFYEWVASEIDLENWNTPEFINGVNNGSFRPQGEEEEIDLTDAIALASGWYLEEIMGLIKKHTPSEIERFVICGGGAIKFGLLLKKRLWGESVVCPKPDIANSLGQLVEMALEVSQ
jgi:hypothetical protein